MPIKTKKTQKRNQKSNFTWERYLEYLKSEEWRRKRWAKAYQNNFTCEMCGCYCKDHFEIHHKTYLRVFHELLSDLMFLCPTCHKRIEIKKRVERRNAKFNPNSNTNKTNNSRKRLHNK